MLSQLQAEWREHCASSDKLVDMLKERLEVTKLELQEQDTLKDEIDGDLQGMRKALKTQERQHQLKTTSVRKFSMKYIIL